MRRNLDGKRTIVEGLLAAKRACGERQHSAKLTPSKVRAIRQAYAEGAVIAILAREYGIAWPSIKKVVSHISWKHI